jgi:hypothetical protein
MNPTQWKFIYQSRIDSSGRISIPKEVFDYGILENPDEISPVDAWWAYEKTSGVIVISNDRLNDESYHVIGRRKVGDKSDNYRTTVPRAFFEASSDDSARSLAEKAPSIAQLKPNAEVFFISHEEMMTSSPSSMYVLSFKKIQRVFGYDEKIKGVLDHVPV